MGLLVLHVLMQWSGRIHKAMGALAGPRDSAAATHN